MDPARRQLLHHVVRRLPDVYADIALRQPPTSPALVFTTRPLTRSGCRVRAYRSACSPTPCSPARGSRFPTTPRSFKQRQSLRVPVPRAHHGGLSDFVTLCTAGTVRADWSPRISPAGCRRTVAGLFSDDCSLLRLRFPILTKSAQCQRHWALFKRSKPSELLGALEGCRPGATAWGRQRPGLHQATRGRRCRPSRSRRAP